MKKRILPKPVYGDKPGAAAATPKTGEHCPISGWWSPSGRETDVHLLAKGSIMPANDGTAVIWTLIAREMGMKSLVSGYPVPGLRADSC